MRHQTSKSQGQDSSWPVQQHCPALRAVEEAVQIGPIRSLEETRNSDIFDYTIRMHELLLKAFDYHYLAMEDGALDECECDISEIFSCF